MHALLGPEGPFASRIEGYRVRSEQIEMANAVEASFHAGEVLVCEAGTGTGKTLAYLVPALAAGMRTVISTATRTLQDQLYHRDLPLVVEALGAGHVVALLKGRQNYLCIHRLERALADPAADYRRRPVFEHLHRWSGSTGSGDLEEVRVLGDDPGLHGQVSSTTENCLGGECPHFDRCFVVKARREAAAADLVVVNHHLLFADLVLRDVGFGELLPEAQAIVLDEAHKVPDIASMFFGRQLSGLQLGALCYDALRAAAVDAADMPDLERTLERFDGAQLRLREALVALGRRPNWQLERQRSDIAGLIDRAGEALDDTVDALSAAADRSADLDNCLERAASLQARWSLFDAGDDDEAVRWVDATTRNFTVYETPISIADAFSTRVAASGAAWVLTSATLAVAGEFEHFKRTLGLEAAREGLWSSPFDYQSQSLLYVPPLTCEPRDDAFERDLVAACLPVLAASGGRAFFLFISYRMLHAVAARLADQTAYTLLVQGSAPRRVLLEQFLSSDAAVLLGTASFWEGVDVRGEKLSCVIIDKLPFGVPDDPVTRARGNALRAEGLDPFEALQLPDAIMSLKQGAGRLIRDVTDRGVLVICDTRLMTKRYGEAFLRSLPDMPLTRTIGDVEAFFGD